jgi:hypothetical protein
MLARNTSGRPGTRLPLSLFVPCWSHVQSHAWGRMGHVPDKNQTSLWNGPGYGQNQYETAERVKTVNNIRTSTAIWHTHTWPHTRYAARITGTAPGHAAAEADGVMHTHT